MKAPQPIGAVIAGFETNGLGVARALVQGGVRSLGVCGPAWHPAQATRSAKIFRAASWSEPDLVSGLIEVGKSLGVRVPLFITKDEAVTWISANRAEIEKYFHLALPSHDIVETMMSKAKFTELAIARGWPLPATWQVSSRAELESLGSNIIFPCIIKPQVKSSIFRSNSGQKAYVLASLSELEARYAEISRWEPEVVIQEWIPGGDDRIAFVLAYVSPRSDTRKFFAGRKLRQWPVQCGNTALCEPAPEDWARRILPLADEIFSDVAYSGLGSIEFKMRLEDDSPVIIEPTVGRTNYQNEIAVINGCNLPLLAYCDLLGLPLPAESPRSEKQKLLDGFADFRAAKIYYAQETLSLSDWQRSRAGKKKYMLWRSNDPAPFLAWALSLVSERAARTLSGR